MARLGNKGKGMKKQEEEVKQPEVIEPAKQETLNTSALPEDLAQLVTHLQEQMMSGDLQAAVQDFQGIKTHLLDTERYNPNQPVDLSFERAHNLKKTCYKRDDESSKFKVCEVLCSDSARKLDSMSYREVYKLRKTTLSIRESKYQPLEQNGTLLKACSQGILVELAA